jgi:hypothetical protein
MIYEYSKTLQIQEIQVKNKDVALDESLQIPYQTFVKKKCFKKELPPQPRKRIRTPQRDGSWGIHHRHQSINQMATINDSTSDDEYVNILFEAIRTLESCMNIPSGWGDFFTEEPNFRFENEPEQDGDGWETVGPKPVVITRAPKWCRKGNACKLANCMFSPIVRNFAISFSRFNLVRSVLNFSPCAIPVFS